MSTSPYRDSTPSAAPAQPKAGRSLPGRRVVILHTSDEHSTLLALGPEVDDREPAEGPRTGRLVGGIARRATLLKAERRAAEAEGAAVMWEVLN